MSYEHLKRQRIGEIAQVQTGPFGSQLHKSDYQDYGTPIITVEHLGSNRIIHENLPLVSDADKERLRKYCLQEGDIVFSRVGSVDRRAYVHKSEDGWLFSGRCLRVRVVDPNVNSRYLSYYFGLEAFKEYVRSIAVGATMPSLNTKIMSELEVETPTREEQDGIAATLSALDDKIELNNRINKTLEEMAQAIFKQWFVDFDFPDENGQPYKSSGGEMEESELGLIPKGWKIGVLGDIADNIRDGVASSNINDGNAYIGLEHMPRKCLALSNWDETPEVMSNKFKFNEGDVLFGKLRPYFHKVGVASISGICSTDILVITTKEPQWYSFALMHLFSDVFIDYTNAVSTGTKMPRTNWADMARYQIVIPNLTVVTRFEELIHPLICEVKKNVLENRYLAKVRDSLLPKLMSGEIRVPLEEV